MTAILFDLGGTHLRCATSDGDRRLHNFSKTRIENFLHGQEPEIIWEKIMSQMTSYINSVQNLSRKDPIVLSFPGPIENHRRILGAPTITGGAVFIPDLRVELMNRTGHDVYILNDLSAAAWSFSEKVAIECFIVVTVSSGIGSKIFDRKNESGVLDSKPYAGEIGHFVVDESPDAPRCDCGGIGHLGAIASGRGIERRARSIARNDLDSFARSNCVREFGASLSTLTNEEHLVPAAKSGDEWALRVIRDSTKPLARVLLASCLGVGLEQIVIIGGFPLSLGSVYLNLLRALIQEGCDYTVLSDSLPGMIQLGDVGEEACLEGAAAYASRVMQLTQ